VEQDETKTEAFEAAPTAESPAVREAVEPRYFGVSPAGLVAVLAAFALGAGVVLLVSGYVVVGVLLFVAAALLAALFTEQARRRRESAFDRATAAAVDHTRALAGFTGSSLRAWTGTGHELTRLRLEAKRRARERSQLQYALGGATYAGDEPETARLREAMQAVDARIAACVQEANEVVERYRATTARERLAVRPTEIRPPEDMSS
jgi:hypothetical protein